MTGEFELIERYFRRPVRRADVMLPAGDDAAVVAVPAGHELVITTDSLIEGVHFDVNGDPAALGHKALAVNLSDLAAMGAEPAWCTLALTLPQTDEAWLDAFSAGFYALADRASVALVGGDTTRGPRAMTVTALGLVPAGAALTRSGARAGDLVYVTGTLGDAGLALLAQQGKLDLPPASLAMVCQRLHWPQPRLAAGAGLRGLAHAAIDISDGFAADLGHILHASGVGARIELKHLPLSAALRAHCAATDDWSLPLAGGDDYELCFTVAPHRREELEKRARSWDVDCTCIGRIEPEPGLVCLLADGSEYRLAGAGWQHF